jgi:UDP-N-acetylmuramate--alanine ligase
LTDSSNIEDSAPPNDAGAFEVVRRIAPRVHLVGIGGSGMKALAEVLIDLGESVTGSDANPDPQVLHSLRQQGAKVFTGHAAEHIGPSIEQVIYSPAIPKDNVERVEADRRGIPQSSYPEAIAELTRNRRTIAVAGTHGKSTTTAMLAHLLRGTEFDPLVLCGAECINADRNGWLGYGDWAVVEACEYRRHFLGLTPEVAVILGIEPDHFDAFPTLDMAADAYREFAARVTDCGCVLFSEDCPLVRECVGGSTSRRTSFGFHPTADWTVGEAVRTSEGWQFTLMHQGKQIGEFHLPRPGRHDVHNAIAALAAAVTVGVPIDALRERLSSFRGLKRRFEFIGIRNGVTLIDDYAHHPTEVAAVLSTAQALSRSAISRRRIWCAFQPHQVMRTRRLFDEFVAALSLADRVLVLPAYTARESDQPAAREVSRELASHLTALGCRARMVMSLDHLRETMETFTSPGDIFLTLGAGDIGRVHHESAGRIPGYLAG